MRTRVHGLIIMLMLLAVALTACATGQNKTVKEKQAVITSYTFSEGALTLVMSESFQDTYTIYKPGDPFIAVVELPGVLLGKTAAKIASTSGGISEIRFTEISTPSELLRLEVQMDSPSDLVAVRTGQTLRLSMVSEQAPVAASEAGTESAQPETAQSAPEPEMAAGPATEITNIRFEPAGGNVLNLIVQADGALAPQVYAMGEKVIIDFADIKKMSAAIPSRVMSPVKGIRKSLYEGSPRLILDIEKDRRFTVTSVGNSVLISFHDVFAPKAERKADETKEGDTRIQATAAPEEETKTPRGKFSGKIISLDFQDADIVPIFRFIGEVAEMNVVIHPDVKGKVTLKLMNVPWDQALDILLKLSSLDRSIDGNILTIAPVAVFTAQREEAARLKAASVKAADLIQGTVHLEYIEAAEFEKHLKNSKVLSDRGSIRIDGRTNTLIINDTEDVLSKIVNNEKLYWDTPDHGKLQVMIEARIIEVNTNFSRTLGISWGGNATDENFSFIDDDSTYDFSMNTPVGSAGPTVDLSGGGISIGYLETFAANMSISALESVGEARSLANPKVLTIDGQGAKISQGTQIPYSTVSDGATKTEFVSATLSLDVTPEVQPNNIIKLKVKATNDSPTLVEGADSPAISSQSVDTNALIRDGETLVLGGIYKQKDDDSHSGVPWLKDIPVLGWLFKSRSVVKSQTELLIFITPKIVSRGAREYSGK